MYEKYCLVLCYYEFQDVRYVHVGILIKKKVQCFPVDSGMSNFCTGGFCIPQTSNQGGAKKLRLSELLYTFDLLRKYKIFPIPQYRYRFSPYKSRRNLCTSLVFVVAYKHTIIYFILLLFLRSFCSSFYITSN